MEMASREVLVSDQPMTDVGSKCSPKHHFPWSALLTNDSGVGDVTPTRTPCAKLVGCQLLVDGVLPLVRAASAIAGINSTNKAIILDNELT